jgi:hypothetical protein
MLTLTRLPGESVGYDADQPAGGSAADKKSILAHAFVWCTDQPFIDEVWRRAELHLLKKKKRLRKRIVGNPLPHASAC